MPQRMPSLQFILSTLFNRCLHSLRFTSLHTRPLDEDNDEQCSLSTNNDAGAPDDAADHHRDYQPETQTLARCMERARARLASRLMDETK